MGNADGDPVPPHAAAGTKLRKPQENCEEMEKEALRGGANLTK